MMQNGLIGGVVPPAALLIPVLCAGGGWFVSRMWYGPVIGFGVGFALETIFVLVMFSRFWSHD